VVKKLEGLFQSQVTASQFFVNLIKLAFLKALQSRKILPITLSLINVALR